jgi:uncharacterized protein YegJ (DUF2314 family)
MCRSRPRSLKQHFQFNANCFFHIILYVLSCKEKKGYVSKDENAGDAVYSVTNEDEEMNKAIIDAQRTYNDFLIAFKDPDSLMDDFAVKMRFDYGDNNGEHMWLNDLYIKNGKVIRNFRQRPDRN